MYLSTSLLAANDYVGMSFWLACAIMLAAAVFFFVERSDVKGKWRTSLTVAGLVNGIAFWHYLYMREAHVASLGGMADATTTVFRYIDWLLTVPLLIIEFYLILRAVTNVAGQLFMKLFVGSLVMLVFGYLGESGGMNVTIAFVIAMAAWIYMIQVLYSGDGKTAVSAASPAVQSAYKTMMLIIIFGWAVYPLGYVMGYLVGGENVYAANLNLIYNMADFVNKILFGLIIWHVAVKESHGT